MDGRLILFTTRQALRATRANEPVPNRAVGLLDEPVIGTPWRSSTGSKFTLFFSPTLNIRDNIHLRLLGSSPKTFQIHPGENNFSRCSVFSSFTDKMSGHCLIMADRRTQSSIQAQQPLEALIIQSGYPRRTRQRRRY